MNSKSKTTSITIKTVLINITTINTLSQSKLLLLGLQLLTITIKTAIITVKTILINITNITTLSKSQLLLSQLQIIMITIKTTSITVKTVMIDITTIDTLSQSQLQCITITKHIEQFLYQNTTIEYQITTITICDELN